MYNLFIFFRDYRIRDNLGLIKTLQHYDNVLPIFIFVDDQINPQKKINIFQIINAVFMRSIHELNKDFSDYSKELYLFHGSNIIEVLENIQDNIDIEGVHYNMDYTPYLKRQKNGVKNKI